MRRALFAAILEKLFKALDEATYEAEVKKLEKLFKDTAAAETFKLAKAIVEQAYTDCAF